MHKGSTVSNSEWVIMELLWVRPYTLMELVTELGVSVGWRKSTVATMIRRMTEKGIVNYTEKGRAKVFAPAIAREAASLEQAHGLLKRAFHGSIAEMVNAIAKEKSLTASDIAELYQVLKEAESALK